MGLKIWNTKFNILCKKVFIFFIKCQPSVQRSIRPLWNKSSVKRQKGESQNGCFKKTKHAKFSEKRTFLTRWYAQVRVHIRGLEMYVFRKIWCALFSWNIRFEIHPFALLPMKWKWRKDYDYMLQFFEKQKLWTQN